MHGTTFSLFSILSKTTFLVNPRIDSVLPENLIDDGRNITRYKYISTVAAPENHIDNDQYNFILTLFRHILMVYRRMKVDQVPERYVLDRWRKDLKRGYQSITNIYDSDVSESQGKRYNSLIPMMHLFQQLASQSEDKTSVVSRLLEDVIQKLMLDFDNVSISSTPATTPPTEKVIHSPVRVRARGRPPTKRKLSAVEKVINRSKHSTKKKMRDEPTDAQQFNDPATIPQTIVSTQFSFTTLL
ncbi:uncharacterized protein LOC124932988 [Impatiens glandulifera]|uniref:uncharacterized protein LOC124932988 n=1 Tax=Impatiens glandulifera TaxID=253017 RepID=UPI001FB0B945|nr:uncharacterized protein LOC124932988 [Impatiens glandulifera]